MNALAEKIKKMPLAGKMLLCLGVFVVLFYGVYTPVADKLAVTKLSIDSRESKLEAQANGSGVDTDAKLNNEMTTLGRPTGAGQSALSRRVDDVLAAHKGVTEKSRQSRSGLGDDKKTQVTALDLTIECSTADMMGLLADLEKAPEIGTISKVTIAKVSGSKAADSTQLSVSLSVESWPMNPSGNS